GKWAFAFHDSVQYQTVFSDHKAKSGVMTHVAGVSSTGKTNCRQCEKWMSLYTPRRVISTKAQ
ncbi:MAG: hypothetical protein AAF497_18230, partial [Planctomycetota bacterium]